MEDRTIPLKLFPARIRDRKVTARPMINGGVAGGAFDTRKNEAIIPTKMNAYDMHIREHESAHAIWTPKKFDGRTLIAQALEDARIEMLLAHQYARGKNFMSRKNQIFTAVKDLRSISQHAKLAVGNPVAKLSLIRSAAILSSFDCSKSESAAKKHHTTVSKIARLLGIPESKINQALEFLRKNDFAGAKKVMARYFAKEKPKPEPPPISEPGGMPKPGGKGKGTGSSKSDEPSFSDSDEDGDPIEDGSGQGDESEESEDSNDSKGGSGSGKGGSKDSKESGESNGSEESDDSEDGEDLESEDSNESKDGEGEDLGDAPKPEESKLDTSQDSKESKESKKSEPAKSDEEPTPGEAEDINIVDEEDLEESVSKTFTEMEPTTELEKAMGKLFSAISSGAISDETANVLSPSTLGELASDSSLTRHGFPKMEIVHAYNSPAARPTMIGVDKKMLYSGTSIKASRLASAATSPTPVRCFVKESRRRGGTVLIDASSSMGVSEDILQAVALAIPAGTIAYYSANSDSVGPSSKGWLVLYSYKGKRWAPIEPRERLPNFHGANLVDFAALQWLMKQQMNRYFITDGGFTGCYSLSNATKELVDRGLERKQLILYPDLAQFIEQEKIQIDQEILERIPRHRYSSRKESMW